MSNQVKVEIELRKLSIALGEVPLAFCVISSSKCEIRERGDIDERWMIVSKGATAREALEFAWKTCKDRIEERGRHFREGRAAASEYNREVVRGQLAAQQERRHGSKA